MPNLKPGDRIAGKYRILRALGSGGMGVVYQAQHERLNRQVAIKVLQANFGRQNTGIARFEQEIRAMSLVNNPHVTRALDADILDDGSLYLVMEYLEGRDLRTELKLRRTIPYPEAIAYVMQACDGVAAVHDVGIVHRDLKPQNLFLTQLDAARSVKVLDFGLAKFLQTELVSLTATDTTVGTPLYMSPEQLCRPQDVSPRSDVWALGVVLYELIAGISPFQAESPGAVVAAVVLEEPVVLTDVVPDVPAALNDLFAEVFVKSPAERLGSVRALAERLAPFGLAREAIHVSSSAPSPSYPAAARERTTMRPELSERIKSEVAAYAAEGSGTRNLSLDGLNQLPVLAGVSLPRTSSRLKEPGQEIHSESMQSAILLPSAMPSTHPRRKRALILGTLVGLAGIVLIAMMHKYMKATDPRMKPPAVAVGVPVDFVAPVDNRRDPPGVLTTPSASSIAPANPPSAAVASQGSGTQSTRARAARARSAELTRPAASASRLGAAPAQVPTASDGKPLHL